MRRRLALLVVLTGPASVEAEPCAPRVELAGDPAAIAQVGGELGRLGVATGGAAPGCRVLHAQVQLEDAGVAVAIIDGARRSEGRVVTDVALAAAWIESWSRDELAWTSASHWGAAPPPLTTIRTAPPADRPATPPITLLDRIAIGAGYEQSFTNDTASWQGFGGHACVRVGGLCLGARVRYAQQDVASLDQLASTRSDAVALATVSTSFDLGRMTLAPELGAGVGRYATERPAACVKAVDVPCDPVDAGCGPPCPGPGMAVLSAQHEQSYAPRLAAALRIALPLFDHVWLDGIASFTYGPLAHDAPFPSIDKTAGPPEELAKRALPGEPSGALQLGVGLRIGTP